MHCLPSLLAIALLSTSAFGQKASYTIFGKACKQNIAAQLPLSAVTLPKIGKTFIVRTTASWASFASGATTVLLSGSSNRSWGALRLPFDMVPLSRVGLRFYCQLYVAADIPLVLPMRSGPARSFDVKIPIPNQRSLLGLRFYQQALSFRSGIGESEVIASRGAAALIGR